MGPEVGVVGLAEGGLDGLGVAPVGTLVGLLVAAAVEGSTVGALVG